MANTSRLTDPLAGADRETLIATIYALRQALNDCIQERIQLQQRLDIAETILNS